MRRVGLLAIVAVFASVLSAAPVQAAPLGAGDACSASTVSTMMRDGSNMETVALRTFHLVIKAAKKSYAVGDTAVVHAKVTRPAHEDPLQLGVTFDPPKSFPAEEVNVGIGLRIGDVFLFGFGITDENGEADIKIKIQPYTKPGTAIADAFSWKRQLETPCLNVEENGYTFAPGIFKVTR